MTILITLLAFGAGFLVVFAVNLMLVDVSTARRAQLRERLESELRREHKQRAQTSVDSKKAIELATASSEDICQRLTLRERLDLMVEQSGTKLNGQRAMTIVLVIAVVFGASGGIAVNWTVGLIAALVGGALPLVYFSILRSRRMRKLQSQLPEVFDLMSRMLRAGRTIPQAFQTVGDEFPRPAAEEFGYAYEQQNLGLSPEAAMRDLARRTGLLELRIFVMAVMIHQQTGGNLADLLDKLADIIRGRFKIMGMIRSLTAEGRMQAVILLMLPPLLLAAISVINRPYARVLFEYPMLLGGMFFFMTLGAAWMYRIVNFDF